jgi:hypothetical protein
VDGRVLIGEGVGGEAVQLPGSLDGVQGELAIARDEETTSVRIAHLSLVGTEPHLVLQRLSGAIRIGRDDVVLEQVAVETAGSMLTLDGALRDLNQTGGMR